MKVGTVVRRYAAALFALAREKGQVEDIGRETEFLGELFADRKLGAFLRNPRVPASERRKVFLDKVGPHISPLMRQFVSLLFDRRREEVLEGIARAYRRLAQEAAGVEEGVLEAARPVGEAERAEIEAALAKRFGKRVQLQTRIDPALVGGLRVTLGHRRIDLSVNAQLQGMRVRLLSAPISRGQI